MVRADVPEMPFLWITLPLAAYEISQPIESFGCPRGRRPRERDWPDPGQS